MSSNVVWAPQPGPQEAFIKCPFEESFYGGAAGGGKSDALIGDFAAGVEQYGDAWRGVMFRRYIPDLGELERRCIEIFGPIYGVECYKKSTRTWHLPTPKGTSTLKLAAMEDRNDVYKHYGFQYTWIGFDELTQWESDWWYENLFTRLRSASGAPCYMRSASNPGNVGHAWVKDRFRIGIHPAMQPFEVTIGEGDHSVTRTRVFIPAKLDDNRILMENDPGYKARLGSIADPVMRRALMDGDWDIVAGAAFPEFRKDTHVIPSAPPPPGVLCWRACDWGYDKPYAVLWAYRDFDGIIIIFHELYGQGDKPNVGSRESEEEVRDKIVAYERDMGITVSEAWLDPQCWGEAGGGPTIYDKLGGAKLGWRPWPKGPRSRVNQKSQIHTILRVINGRPQCRIMAHCQALIRTLSSIPTSQINPEDVNSDFEDHSYDALRGLVCKRVPTKQELDELLKYEQYMRQQDEAVGMTRYGGW